MLSTSTTPSGELKEMTKEQMGLGFKGILNSGPAIVAAMVGANGLGAALFMLAEDASWNDSFYWAWVTSMSIGYGDISPATTVGRIVAILLGAFVLYVITPLVVGKFVMSALEDQNAFTHEEQEEIKRQEALQSIKLDDILFLVNEVQKSLDQTRGIK